MLVPIDLRIAASGSPRSKDRRDVNARASTSLPLTPDDFCSWIGKSAPGERTVYYRGDLGRDRCRSTTSMSERDRQRLIALARQALVAAEDGRLHLLQRRHAAGDYSYIAVRARKRAKARAPTMALSVLKKTTAPNDRDS
jgi:hypothetical protein